MITGNAIAVAMIIVVFVLFVSFKVSVLITNDEIEKRKEVLKQIDELILKYKNDYESKKI